VNFCFSILIKLEYPVKETTPAADDIFIFNFYVKQVVLCGFLKLFITIVKGVSATIELPNISINI
jgi:hypothetical protein